MQNCAYDFCRRTRCSTYQHDSESDLDYAMARYYASRTGRFMTPDPGHVGANVGDPQSWNAYPYSRNDPVNLVDPTGKAYDFCILVYCERDVPDKELLTRLGGLSGLNGPLMDDSRKYSLGGDWWKLGERGPILQRGTKVGEYVHKSFDGPLVASEAGISEYATALLNEINPVKS